MTYSRLTVVWHWMSMGPYHFARMKALAQMPDIDLTVVENTCRDDHGWTRDKSFKSVITLSHKELSREVLKATRPSFANVLNHLQPDVIVSAAGYFEPHSLSVIRAYKKAAPANVSLLWSESTQIDNARRWSKELIKRLIVSMFDGALVAGEPHASYLRQLGMPANKIQVVGNCVDNDFFSDRTDEERRQASTDRTLSIPQNFFLFVGRMIPAKNLRRLLEAYRQYRQRAGSAAWDLVLVGTGPEEISLRQQAQTFGSEGIRFAGLQQLEDLPRYYARAKCLVLPSVSEPWGLVVNEAMASAIPVLVSKRCGCAIDLVRDGLNGFIFDPLRPDLLAELLFKLSNGEVSVESMGINGRKAVAEFTPTSFAQRVAKHLRSVYARRDQQPRESYKTDLLTRTALSGTDFISSLWARRL